MINIFNTIIVIFCASLCVCQVTDSFSDGDFFGGPSWQGDTGSYIVNVDLNLQLNARDAGLSRIYTPLTGLGDSMVWNMWFELDFSPSNSNQMRTYIWSDDVNMDIGNAYFIEVGETGNQDALHFYKQVNGESQLVASGTLGALGGSSSSCRLRIEKSGDGFWDIYTDYTGGRSLTLDASFFDDSLILGDGYFMIECEYTSSRVDKFRFDDIDIREKEKDITPPSLLSLTLDNQNEIEICFDEIVSPSSASVLGAFEVDNGIGNPIEIAVIEEGACLLLTFNDIFQPGITYTLSIDDIQDKSGNGASFDDTFSVLTQPGEGDIVINEILFNPLTDGEDFVELYNLTNKSISIEGMVLTNEANGQQVTIDVTEPLAPNGYIALTEDIKFLQEQYKPKSGANIYSQSLPTLGNDDGNVTIAIKKNGETVILDSYDYDESAHNPVIDNEDGVSLERISPTEPTQDDGNWTSAASIVNYATPGYQNSAFSTSNTISDPYFTLSKKVFSPNGDGSHDLVEINYTLPGHSYVLTMQVFDVSGNFVMDLYENELLSTQGTLEWDGKNASNESLDIGIYILWFELFNPNGDVRNFKKTVVLADFLD